MAKREIIQYIDDLDGSEAAETVRFSFGGLDFEIDLSLDNVAKMTEALDPYMAAARRIGRSGMSKSAPARSGVQLTLDDIRDENKAIREWAEAKGIEVASRGRIKQEIVDQYHAEQAETANQIAMSSERRAAERRAAAEAIGARPSTLPPEAPGKLRTRSQWASGPRRRTA